jgi:hypothetical protein
MVFLIVIEEISKMKIIRSKENELEQNKTCRL